MPYQVGLWTRGPGDLEGFCESRPCLPESLAVATPCGLIWNCTWAVGGPCLWLLAPLPFILCCCLSFCFFSFFSL